MNVIQSSIPSSGTMVFANIVMELTNTSLYLGSENLLLQALAKQSAIFYGDKSVAFARLANVNFYANKSVCTGIIYYDNEGNATFLKEIDISELYFNASATDGSFFFLTHSSPKNILQCSQNAKALKRVYVLRDFRDAFHSHIRSTDKNESGSAELKKISQDKKFMYIARYFDVEMFLSFLREWKKHLIEYLNDKEGFILVKYENLMKNPTDTILKLGMDLGVKIDEQKAALIADKYLNKEVWLYGKPTEDFAHYNKNSTKDSWRDYFSPTMQKIVCDEIGDLLVYFGYEENSEWHSEETLSNTQAAIEQIYKSYPAIANIDFLLQNERAVFFGAGEYLRLLSGKLKNFSKTAFIVDENTDIIGKQISGVNIASIDRLVCDYGEYDKILISVYDKYHSAVYSKLKFLKIAPERIINIFSANIYALLKSEKN